MHVHLGELPDTINLQTQDIRVPVANRKHPRPISQIRIVYTHPSGKELHAHSSHVSVKFDGKRVNDPTR